MTLVLVIDALRANSLAVLGTLAQASLEAAVVAAAVFALCRTAPALPARVKVWLWWLVCAKLVVGLLPVPSVTLPLMPARTLPSVSAGPAAPAAGPPLALPVSGRGPHAVVVPPEPAPVSIPYAALWPVLLVSVWIGVAAMHALGLARALGRARYLRRHAEPAHASVVTRLAQLVRMFGLAVRPGVFGSRLTAVPLLTGVLKPTILLPAASPAVLSRTELDLVLGHELAHIRRGDLVWGWLPAIAARLFFFDPLARLAAREYLAAREEACDAEVLQTLSVAPADYGQLLVKLGVATTDDVLAAAGSSPTFAMLKRRLIMLDRSHTPSSRWWWTLAGGTAVLLPLSLVAQPAVPAPPAPLAAIAGAPSRPLGDAPPPAPASTAPLPPAVGDAVGAEDQDAPPPPPAPPAAPAAPAPPAPPRPAAEADTPAPPAPPAPAAAPVPPAPPTPADPGRPPVRREHHGQGAWVLLEPGNENMTSGAHADRAAALRHRRSSNDRLVWFRHNGAEYVSYDPAVIQAVRDAYEPVEAVGEEMGRVGGRMGAQGSAQGAIGAQQGELGAQQARLAAEMTKVAAEHAARVAADLAEMQRVRADVGDTERRATSADERQQLRQQRDQARTEREQRRAEQRAQRAPVEAKMQALADQQHALGEKMRALGAGMETHGAEMKRLGSKLEEALAAAEARVAEVLGDAVTTGAARPAK